MSGTEGTISTRILSWFRNDEQSRLLTDPSTAEYAYLPLRDSSPHTPRHSPRGTRAHLRESTFLPPEPRRSISTHRDLTTPELALDVEQQTGVAKIEALHRVFGKGALSTSWLYASIGAVSYIYSLDQNTTSNYLPLATSAYNRHSIIGLISTAESIITAVAKPFISKICNVTSRPTAYTVTLAFYVLGYLIVACSSSVNQVVIGMLVYTVGHSGLHLVTEVIIADLSPLKWRGLASSLTSLPFIVNAFIGAEIVNAVLSKGNWRWGYGMFAIIMPAVMAPAIFILFLADRRASQLGTLSFSASLAERRRHQLIQNGEEVPQLSYLELVKDFMTKMDFGGLSLISLAFALLLLPPTLTRTAKKTWSHPGMLTMEILGVVVLAIFILYERYVASHPLMPSRILVNRAFLAAVSVDFLYFMSGSLRASYLSSYVYITKDWSNREWTYFNNSTTVVLCIFGTIAGLVLRYTHRYKSLQISGLVIRVFAMWLTVHGTGPNGSSLELISTQLLLGVGGAFNVVGSRVASQASVPHQDLASVIALLSLWTQLGGSVGSAIATAVWKNTMPDNLAHFLPDLPKEQIEELYGSISRVREYPFNDPIRQGVIKAYNKTVAPLFVAALIVSVFPVLAALFLPNYYLGDTQNAVDGVGIDGTVKPPDSDNSSKSGEYDESEEDEEDAREEGPSEETRLVTAGTTRE